MKLQEIFTDLIEKGLGNIKYFKTIPGTKISYEVLYSQVSHGLGLRIGLRITKKVPRNIKI